MTIASNKPDIHGILWKDLEIRGLDLRAEEDKVTVKGELFLFVLYSGTDEDNPLQWLEQAIPFTGAVECAGCTSDMVPIIETTMIQNAMEIAPDADGGGEGPAAGCGAGAGSEAVSGDRLRAASGCFIRRKSRQNLYQSPVRWESLLVKNFSKCRVSDRLQVEGVQNKVLQICHGEGSIKVDEKKIVGKRHPGGGRGGAADSLALLRMTRCPSTLWNRPYPLPMWWRRPASPPTAAIICGRIWSSCLLP